MAGEDAMLADSHRATRASSKVTRSSSQNSSKASAKTEKKKAAAKSTPKSHKIRNGETLSTIARKYGVSVAALKQANGMKNDHLRAGKTLTIPTKASSKKSTKSKSRKKRRR